MQSLGEMATWLPLTGAIPQFCARYVDGAMGFAVGWNVSFCSPSSPCGGTNPFLELVSKCDNPLRRNIGCLCRYPILERRRRHQRCSLDFTYNRPRCLPQYFRCLNLRRSGILLCRH